MKRTFLFGTLALVSTITIALISYIGILFIGNQVIDEQMLVMDSTTTLVDESGKIISKLYIEDRELVTINEIPDHVQEAFIAIEDTRFYQHPGIDGKSILRALYKDILAGNKVEGGSTITQQLAKNVFLSNEKTWLRKTKEAVISINLERKYSKKKLLEMYLNQIYFGHGAYGIETAAKLYFGKSSSELTVDEGALLAGIPKSPTNYSPINYIDKSKHRRNLVIDMMYKKGYIKAEEAVRLKGKTIALSVNEYAKNPAFSTYIDMVMEEANTRFKLTNEELMTGGYTITLPINEEIQQIAFELFKQNDYFPGTDSHVEGAFVLMDVTDGGVLAVTGGRNYVHKGVNRVVVKRQPGSTIKPLAVYGPALEEKEYHPYSMLVDQPINYGDYSPTNLSGTYKGKISMYDALKYSTNAPAVWLLDKIGVDYGKKYIEKAGISIPDKGLAIALGGLEKGISPLEMTKAYRAFAKDGKVVEPFFIKKMINQKGEIIKYPEVEEKSVFSAQTAWYVTRMLKAVVDEGTAKSGKYDGHLAGKTGTTSLTTKEGAIRDVWFVGYTPEVVGAIWMGYDKTDENHFLTKGSSFPTSLFKKILTSSSLDQSASFSAPLGVDELEEPVIMVEGIDLTAKLTFKPLGLFTVQLNWDPGEDDRVIFRVYEEKDGKWTHIDNVKGKGLFEKEKVNIFNLSNYYVVPYNPQTEEIGQDSNVVSPKINN